MKMNVPALIISNFFRIKFYLIDSFRNDDDFLAVLLLMGALVFLLAIIFGIVLILIILFIIVSFIGGGIISASVLVGLQQKSMSKGFKTFILSLSILGSTVLSVFAFWCINSIKDWWNPEISVIAGIICGVFAGWLLGLFFFHAASKMAEFLRNKYDERIDSRFHQ